MIIVETPLQLLCAYEYIYSKDLGEPIYLRLSKTRNDKQMLAVTERLGIKVRTVHTSFKPQYLINNIIFVYKVLESIIKKDHIIIGTISSGFLSLITRFVNKELVVLLDDGIATLLEEKKEISFKRYSIFETNGASIEKNTFRALRSHYKDTSILSDEVYFLGQKLVEIGIMNEEIYVDMVSCVAKDEGQLKYISHRGEFHDKISNIKSLSGVSVFDLDLPVELYLLEKGKSPRSIYTHSSTAAITISILFPRTEVFVVQGFKIDESKFPHAREYYEYVKNYQIGKIISYG